MVLAESDEDLARAAQSGDRVRLGLLLNRHRASLLAQAVSMLGHGPAAEDAVHETFVVALSKLETLRDPAAVVGWLRSVLRNICLMQKRGYREVPAEYLDDLRQSDVGPSAEEVLDDIVFRDWMWRQIDELPEPLQLVVLLRFFTGYRSYEQIAQVCGVPVGTVRSRLHAAKRRLSASLLAEQATVETAGQRQARMREAELISAMSDLNERQDVAAFVDPVAPDVTVVAGEGEATGIHNLLAALESDFEAGVKFHLTNVVSGEDVTVAEGRFENPPWNPGHCPPGAAQIHFHPDGQTRRIAMYYASEVEANQ